MREKTLVVDDEQSPRYFLETVLEREGYEVVLASDGNEAIRVVESGNPHLIILDARTPKVDGIGTCAALRADERTRRIPILFATGVP
jgi:CheY-like chemotaxis protein